MLPTTDALEAQWKGDRILRKNSTVVKNGNKSSKQPTLTIGLDLGDRSGCRCVLDEMGDVILEAAADHAERNSRGFWQDAAEPDCAGNATITPSAARCVHARHRSAQAQIQLTARGRVSPNDGRLGGFSESKRALSKGTDTALRSSDFVVNVK